MLVFYVPSTARSVRDNTSIECALLRTLSLCVCVLFIFLSIGSIIGNKKYMPDNIFKDIYLLHHPDKKPMCLTKYMFVTIMIMDL